MAKGPPESGASKNDLLLADIVLEKGMCTREQVDVCLRRLNEMSERGVSPLPTLGQLLTESGHLTPEQANDTLRLGDREAPRVESEENVEPSGISMGRYVKVDKIGSGGMGEVWKGWDRELRRWIALKFLKVPDPQELARFQREAQTSARLNHPNIGALYDFGTHEGQPYIAMQYVDGGTLSTVPREDRKHLVELMRDAARAVQHAHEKGVVHRDLKPDNLMVDKAGRLYVMDFGLAKQQSVDSSLSMSGTVLGTASYMPPEQARGKLHEVDARSDVYSLGATLYELLTDQRPFRGETNIDILLKVIEGDPRPVHAVNPKIDRDLDTIVMKCLEKDPARRYGSAAEFADDLDCWLKGEAISAHPPSVLYRLRKRLRKRRTIVAAVVLACIGLTFGVNQILKARFKERELYPDVERARELIRTVEQAKYRSQPAHEKRREKLADAERRCRNVIRHLDGYAPAHLVLGLVEKERGRFRKAAAHFTAAIERNPDYELAYLERAMVALEQVFEIEHATEIKSEGDWRGSARETELVAAARKDIARVRLTDDTEEDRHAVQLISRLLDKGPAGILEQARELSPRADERVWRIAGEAEHWRKKYRSAVVCYSNFVDTRQGDARARARLAHMLKDAKMWAQAIGECTRALELEPDMVPALLTRAVVLERTGKTTEALKDLDRVIELRPDLARAYRLRGITHMGRDARAAAVRDFSRAIELDPSDRVSRIDRALIHARNKEFEKALAEANALLKDEPDYVHAHQLRGRILAEKGDLAGARRCFEEALRIQPGFTSASISLGLLDEADPREALRRLNEAVAADGNNSLALYNRGVFRTRTGDFDGAIQDLDRAIEQRPGYGDAHLARGLAWSKKRKHARALEDFDIAVSLLGGNAKAWWARSKAKIELGDFDGALADAERSLKIKPGDYDALVSRGRARRHKGRYKSALEDYQSAIDRDPSRASAYYNRGYLHHTRKEYSEAVREFTLAIERKADYTRAYHQRGITQLRLGELRKALDDFSIAVRLMPDDARARVNRGNTHRKLKNMEEALDDFNKAVSLDPRLPEAYANRALVLHDTERWKECLADYRKVKEFTRPGESMHEWALKKIRHMKDVHKMD